MVSLEIALQTCCVSIEGSVRGIGNWQHPRDSEQGLDGMTGSASTVVADRMLCEVSRGSAKD